MQHDNQRTSHGTYADCRATTKRTNKMIEQRDENETKNADSKAEYAEESRAKNEQNEHTGIIMCAVSLAAII